jgi:ribonuclease P protein component
MTNSKLKTQNSKLRTAAQFERVRREGRTWGSGLVVLNAARNGEETVRCGFITGKKVGKAVQRNRARRLMREAVRLRLPYIQPGWDLVWIARAPILQADFWALLKAVDDLLQRSRVIGSEKLPELPKIAPQRPEESATAGAQSRIIDQDV